MNQLSDELNYKLCVECKHIVYCYKWSYYSSRINDCHNKCEHSHTEELDDDTLTLIKLLYDK